MLLIQKVGDPIRLRVVVGLREIHTYLWFLQTVCASCSSISPSALHNECTMKWPTAETPTHWLCVVITSTASSPGQG